MKKAKTTFKMKKVISLILAFCVIVVQALSVTASAEAATGDVDLDGQVSIVDVTILRQYLAEITTLNAQQLSAADATGDGRVSISDAVKIQQNLAQTPLETFTVTFKDYNGTVLKTEQVDKGDSATPPVTPVRDGYRFVEWSGTYTNVMANQTVTAVYEECTTPTVTVSGTSASAGAKSVKVNVSISNNPGIVGMTLMLNYEDSALTLKSIEKGSALSEMTFTTPKNLSSGCKLPWDAESVEPENATNGTMLTLVFDVSDIATAGKYDIALSYDDGAIIDNDLMPVAVNIVNGSITIQ